MNKIIITALILLTVIFESLFTLFYTNTKFSNYSTSLSAVNISIKQNHWNHAKSKLKNLNLNFKNNKKFMQLFLDRNDLDQIEQTLIKLQTSIKFKQQKNSTTQILKLQHLFNKIAENEQPVIQNIL